MTITKAFHAGIAARDIRKPMEFRLSLTTALPVTTADVTAAGTLYCVPYTGDKIATYDGTKWDTHVSAEFSLALTATSGKPYDVFVYDNAGVLALETLIWTNDTTRATALAYQDGILVKSGTATRRYIGTFYASGTDTTEDSLAKRYLWNYYNRAVRPMRVLEATDSWTYTTATIRQVNGAAANQLDMVIGVSEDAVKAHCLHAAANTNATIQINTGIGLDSTSTFTTGRINGLGQTNVANLVLVFPASLVVFPAAGRHFLSWNEWSTATGTTTWFGDNGTPLTVQTGIWGEVLA